MRKIKIALFIIIGCTLFSCQKRYSLQQDKQLNEIFTDNEVSEIEKMIHYVDDRVVEETGNKDIDQAYHQFLDTLLHSMYGDRDPTYLAPFEEEEKYKFLKSLDTAVFNEFWDIRRARKAVYQDSVYEHGYQSIDLNHRGRYSDYLEKIGEHDAYYQSMKRTLDFAAGLSPTIVAWFLKMHSDFDFTIPKNRLWAAVFILSMEEPHNKKMERYLNQK